MTVANFRYNRMIAPWDAPLAFGIQAVLEYNGLVFNDRYQTDRIRITSISGLDDAQVRDEREVRPGEHGEYAYEAYYGGRHIVLNGEIEAGSLGVCNYLKSLLQAAFAPLEEMPLKFRWFDITDTFDDPASMQLYASPANLGSGNYESFIGSIANLGIEAGLLSWKTLGEDYVLRVGEQRMLGDHIQTIAARVPEGSSGKSFSFIIAQIDIENYLRVEYEAKEAHVYARIISVVANEAQTLASESWPSQELLWFRSRKEGNKIVAEVWTAEPAENEIPSHSVSTKLEGVPAELYGDQVMSLVGFGGLQASPFWTFDNWEVRSLYPDDVVFNARKLSAISISDVQESLNLYKRKFQITLATSDFRAFGATQNRAELTPKVGEAYVLGRTYPRTYPRRYNQYVTPTVAPQENILWVHNRGNVFVEPTFRVYGPFNRITLECGGRQIVWNGSLGAGEYLEIDCHEHVVSDAVGQELSEDLSISTVRWLILEPGWNEIIVNAGEASEETKVVCFWNHGHKS